MIRKTNLKCFKCKKNFVPKNELYYRDTFSAKNLTDFEFICDDCIDEWKNKWIIKKAEFLEENSFFYVTIELENGELFEKVDCTPVDDIVITSLEIPTFAQKELYKKFFEWDMQRKQNKLKTCSFEDEFMKTTFTCETYSGVKFNKVAFRFNSRGKIETEIEIPKYILDQVLDEWSNYQYLMNR